MAILEAGRTAIWRTRAAYLEGGAEYAVRDVARPGKPCRYGPDVEARISALACSAPPEGATRWTLELLERAAHALDDSRPLRRNSGAQASFATTSRDIHIRPDLVLIYAKPVDKGKGNKDLQILRLERIGSHSEMKF